MGTVRSDPTVTRRTALAGIGAGGLALAARGASAQDASPDLSGHPLVGTWAVLTLEGVIPQCHGPDGSVVVAYPPNYVDPTLGVRFRGSGLGRWEADGERSTHFVSIQAISDANGAYIGTLVFEAGMEVSADGQTWAGGGSTPLRIVVRDAANNVIVDQVLSGGGPPVTATRIGATADSIVLPVASAAEATPESGTPTT